MLNGENYRNVNWALCSWNFQVVWRFQIKSKGNPRHRGENPSHFSSWGDTTVLSSHTGSKRLVLKEEARLLGLSHEVVAPQGGLWMVHHLGGNGWVIRRHSVYAALRILLQHKVKKKEKSYLTPHITLVINANSSYRAIWDSPYPSK